jgi:hypothetical protein
MPKYFKSVNLFEITAFVTVFLFDTKHFIRKVVNKTVAFSRCEGNKKFNMQEKMLFFVNFFFCSAVNY